MQNALTDDVRAAIIDAVRQVIEETEKKKDVNADLITRKAVLKILNVSAPTLHDWTRRGLVPSYRMGSRVYYRQSEIQTAMTRRNFGKEVAK